MPFNTQIAERGIIGCVLVEPVMCLHYAKKAGVTDAWFTDRDCRAAWMVIGNLPPEYANAITVAEHAHKTNVDLDIIFLSDCVADSPSSTYVHTWIEELRKGHLRRLITDAVFMIKERAQDVNTEPEDLIGEIQLRLQSAEAQTQPDKSVDGIYNDILKQWECARVGNVSGIKSLWPELQRILGGYGDSRLYIIGARPGDGKSTYMMNEAFNMALFGAKVSIASVEMPEHDLRARMLATACNKSAFGLYTGHYVKENLDEIGEEAKKHAAMSIRINDDPDMNIEKLAAWCSFEVIKHGAQVIFVDYLQLLSTTDNKRGESRNMEIGRILSKLCVTKKSLSVPMIVLSQLNRINERENRPPSLHDLRDSGTIEQDAHAVVLLHHKLYDQDGEQLADSEFIVAKNRSGPTGSVGIVFERNRQRFVSK